MTNYYMLLTPTGLAKVTNAQLTQEKVEITHVAVGDADGKPYSPTGNETALKREVWRGGIASIEVDEQNPNWIIVEAIVPSSVGGFTMREVALYDAAGDMIAIGNYPENYKPVMSDGSTMDLALRTIIEVNNAESVTLKIDPNVIVASRAYVDKRVATFGTDLTSLEERVTQQLEHNQANVEKLQTEKAPIADVQRLDKEKAAKSQVETVERIKADKTYVDGLISGITTVQPRDIYYSIEALKTALPNGDDGLYLVYDTSFTDGAHSFIWSASENEWKDTGLWQSDGVQDDIITLKKINNQLKVPETTNLFNKNSVVNGGYYESDGKWVANTTHSSSGKILCTANQIFTRTMDESALLGINLGNIVTYWDANDNFVAGINLFYISRTFIVPNDNRVAYLRISVLNANLSGAMLVRGKKIPEQYYGYGDCAIKVSDFNMHDNLDITKVNGLSTKRINLLNKTDIVMNGYYNTNGNWVVENTFNSSGKILCTANQIFTRTIGEKNRVGNRITYWDANDNFVSGLDLANNATFIVPNDNRIAYLRIAISQQAMKDVAMLVKGDALPASYYDYADEVLEVTEDNVKESFIKPKHLSVDSVEEKHLANEAVTANKIASKSIGAEKLTIDLATKDVNLFDKKTVQKEGYFNFEDGVWSANQQYVSSDFIECNPNESFVRTVGVTSLGGEHIGNHVTYWDANDNFVTGINLTNSGELFKVPNTATIKKFKINCAINTMDKAMIVRGDKLPPRYYAAEETMLSVKTEHIEEASITKEKLAFDIPSLEIKWGDGLLKPFEGIVNPIITKEMVTDRLNPKGVADPFLIEVDGVYHAFFEVLGGTNPSKNTIHDEIGHAYSYDLKTWTYTQIVFGHELHGYRGAYPNVIEHNGEFYMIPDNGGYDVRVFKATNFPLVWTYHMTLITGNYRDTNIFTHNGVHYMTTTELADTFRLFVNTSDTWLNNQWVEHPLSPIFKAGDNGENGKRGGGKVTFSDGQLYLPMQATPVSTGVYGQYLDLYKISELTTTTARFTRLKRILDRKQDVAWTARAMHHACSARYLNKNVYLVDGQSNSEEYSLGLFIDV